MFALPAALCSVGTAGLRYTCAQTDTCCSSPSPTRFSLRPLNDSCNDRNASVLFLSESLSHCLCHQRLCVCENGKSIHCQRTAKTPAAKCRMYYQIAVSVTSRVVNSSILVFNAVFIAMRRREIVFIGAVVVITGLFFLFTSIASTNSSEISSPGEITMAETRPTEVTESIPTDIVLPSRPLMPATESDDSRVSPAVSSMESDVSYYVHAFYYAWYGNPQTNKRYLHWDHEVRSLSLGLLIHVVILGSGVGKGRQAASTAA